MDSGKARHGVRLTKVTDSSVGGGQTDGTTLQNYGGGTKIDRSKSTVPL